MIQRNLGGQKNRERKMFRPLANNRYESESERSENTCMIVRSSTLYSFDRRAIFGGSQLWIQGGQVKQQSGALEDKILQRSWGCRRIKCRGIRKGQSNLLWATVSLVLGKLFVDSLTSTGNLRKIDVSCAWYLDVMGKPSRNKNRDVYKSIAFTRFPWTVSLMASFLSSCHVLMSSRNSSGWTPL